MSLAVPSDVAAERATAGALAITGEALPGLARLVTPDDFYVRRYGRIFDAAQRPELEGVLGDRRRQQLADLTGISIDELVELTFSAVFLSDGRPWARRIAGTARARRLMRHAAELYNALAAGVAVGECAHLVDAIDNEFGSHLQAANA